MMDPEEVARLRRVSVNDAVDAGMAEHYRPMVQGRRVWLHLAMLWAPLLLIARGILDLAGDGGGGLGVVLVIWGLAVLGVAWLTKVFLRAHRHLEGLPGWPE